MTYSQLIQANLHHKPTNDQVLAIEQMEFFLRDTSPNTVFLLKGYAGTGKTTLMAALVATMKNVNVNSVLLAPTGRSAKVLSVYSGKKAFTIHKEIYSTSKDAFGSIKFVLKENKHVRTLFIIDEASMIADSSLSEKQLFSGRSLLEDLILYVSSGKNCKFILLGDTAQLPPVGANFSPALDIDFLKQNFALNIYSYELTEVVRQKKKSGILKNVTTLRQKIADDNIALPIFKTNNFSDIKNVLGGDLEDLLNECFSDKNIEDSVIVCRSNKRANIFNQEIRNRILFRENEISAGDYIMVVKNNYFWVEENSEIGFIANGDIAEIQRIQRYEELYGFRFVDVTLRFVDYPDLPAVECKVLLDTLMSEGPALTSDQSNQLFQEVLKDFEHIPVKRQRIEEVKQSPYFNALQIKFAYALTCHKTQGGQWRNVLVEQSLYSNDMLCKEYFRWLYTALTRSTENLYLLNFKDDFFAK